MTELAVRPLPNNHESFSSGPKQLEAAREARKAISEKLKQEPPQYPEQLNPKKVQQLATARQRLKELGGV